MKPMTKIVIHFVIVTGDPWWSPDLTSRTAALTYMRHMGANSGQLTVSKLLSTKALIFPTASAELL